MKPPSQRTGALCMVEKMAAMTVNSFLKDERD